MLTQRVELGCVGEYRNDGARDVIISTCTTSSASHLGMTDFLVQQNGGVLECERANQIAEFKFSDITTRNDHVTTQRRFDRVKGSTNYNHVRHNNVWVPFSPLYPAIFL